MIEANQLYRLRIGNLVKYSEGGTIFKVGQISLKSLMVQNDYETTWIEIEEFESIPLTDEWLEKFGFERGGYDFLEVWHPDNPRFIMVGYLNDEEEIKEGLGWNYNVDGDYESKEWEKSMVDIKYVHELQNLYFSLTKTELQIKK